jgi:hypothetical protein
MINAIKPFFTKVCGLLTMLTLTQCASIPVPDIATDSTDEALSVRTVGEPINITGFERPESVLHDKKNDVYLVSNIKGGPRDVDNNGFISRVSPSGQVLQLKWIAGGVNGVTLNAPKGSTISDGVLYVADIDNLRKFDARTGQPLGSIFFQNATFLNDVTSDHEGNVFVTDIGFTTVPAFGPSGTDAIYKVSRKGKLSVIAQGNALLHHPNGIAVLPNGKLQVVTYDPFDGTKELFTINMGGHKSNVIAMPAGLMDGVVVLDKHNLLVSSWESNSVYLVKSNGSISVVASGFTYFPSDIGWDSKRDRLLVPQLPEPGDDGILTLIGLNLH